MTALARARDTACRVAMHRLLGQATRRRCIPRQIYPHTIELAYGNAILGVVAQARASLALLLAALPRLLATCTYPDFLVRAGFMKPGCELLNGPDVFAVSVRASEVS